jgi:protein-tyrosine-phosphatase
VTQEHASEILQGVSEPDVPEILVVCTHNAGRSVAARVLLDHYATGRVIVRSAGSAPGDDINPAVAQVLEERGLDVSMEFPKPLTDEAARAADIVIAMGCGDACPIYPGKRYFDWDLTDPAGRVSTKSDRSSTRSSVGYSNYSRSSASSPPSRRRGRAHRRAPVRRRRAARSIGRATSHDDWPSIAGRIVPASTIEAQRDRGGRR